MNDVPQWMARLRAAMFDAVKESDIKEIVGTLVERAKKGDDTATRMIFEYVLGGRQAQATFVQQNVVVNRDGPKLPENKKAPAITVEPEPKMRLSEKRPPEQLRKPFEYDDDDTGIDEAPENTPSPAEIKARAAALRSSWSNDEKLSRLQPVK